MGKMEQPAFETLSAELAPVLCALEEKRRLLKGKGHRMGLWGGAACLLLGVFLSVVAGSYGVGMGIGGILAVVVYLFCVSAQSVPLTTYYKQEIIGRIVCAFCSGARFLPGQGIGEQVFRSSCLFVNPDRYHTEDLIEGCLDKTDFRCAEVHAEERRTSYSNKQVRHYWVDIFRGFFFVADFHKDFQGMTVVRRNSLIKFSWNGTRVKLENPVFERTFDVYSTDQIEARYLLTPSMMERLLQVERAFGGGISLCFRDSKVIIAIPDRKNHFEATVWHRLTDLAVLETEFATIRSLIGIVQELQLNTRIWSKE